MKWLAYMAALALCALVGAGTHLLLMTEQPTKLLTYETPVRVLTKVVASREEFITEQTYCNTTDQFLPVQVGVWLRNDNKELVPLRFEHDGAMIGPRFDVKISPGCHENYRNAYLLPATIPPGTYEIIGQVCYGGIASLDLPFTCSGWSSEKFEVRSR